MVVEFPMNHFFQSLIISHNHIFNIKHLLYTILRTVLVDPETKITNTKRLFIKHFFSVELNEQT